MTPRFGGSGRGLCAISRLDSPRAARSATRRSIGVSASARKPSSSWACAVARPARRERAAPAGWRRSGRRGQALAAANRWLARGSRRAICQRSKVNEHAGVFGSRAQALQIARPLALAVPHLRAGSDHSGGVKREALRPGGTGLLRQLNVLGRELCRLRPPVQRQRAPVRPGCAMTRRQVSGTPFRPATRPAVGLTARLRHRPRST